IRILESELAEAREAVPGMTGDARVLGMQSCQESAVSIRIVAACDPAACSDVERAMRKRLLARFEAEAEAGALAGVGMGADAGAGAEGAGAPRPTITVPGK
ncbi:MAG: hypothetical protein LBL83_02795, partial [Clostridiales bacterium]|nr:hypothetical protein [Clostridiales bacterium]